MKKEYIFLQDVNFSLCKIPLNELNKVLIQEALTVFGMPLESISAMRKEYFRAGGSEPITKEKIAEIFWKPNREQDDEKIWY